MEIGLTECFEGMKTQSHSLDVIANNLANLNTAGFKADSPFYTLVRKGIEGVPNEAADYVVGATFTNHTQGSMLLTNNPMDFTIEGRGFFCVKTPTGVAYTRDGSFKLDGQGYLVTSKGDRVQGVGDVDIQITGSGTAKDKILIDELGNVSSEGISVGVLKIVDFKDYSKLMKVGESGFVPIGSSNQVTPAEGWALRTGYREGSNVSATSTMVDMINILRRFEMLQKAMMSIMNDVEKKAIEQVGKSR